MFRFSSLLNGRIPTFEGLDKEELGRMNMREYSVFFFVTTFSLTVVVDPGGGHVDGCHLFFGLLPKPTRERAGVAARRPKVSPALDAFRLQRLLLRLNHVPKLRQRK